MRSLLIIVTLLVTLNSYANKQQAALVCPELPSKIFNELKLSAFITQARYSAIYFWSNADGASVKAEHCDSVMWRSFRRLTSLRTPNAAKLSSEILLNPKLVWDAGDALRAIDIVAKMGQIVVPYLQPHIEESILARQTLLCINKQLKSCI